MQFMVFSILPKEKQRKKISRSPVVIRIVSFVRCFGRIYCSTILFGDLPTFISFIHFQNPMKSLLQFSGLNSIYTVQSSKISQVEAGKEKPILQPLTDKSRLSSVLDPWPYKGGKLSLREGDLKGGSNTNTQPLLLCHIYEIRDTLLFLF